MVWAQLWRGKVKDYNMAYFAVFHLRHMPTISFNLSTWRKCTGHWFCYISLFSAPLVQEFPRNPVSDADFHPLCGLHCWYTGSQKWTVHPQWGLHWSKHSEGAWQQLSQFAWAWTPASLPCVSFLPSYFISWRVSIIVFRRNWFLSRGIIPRS